MIFGLQEPKFIYSGTTVLLDNTITEPQYAIGDIVEKVSVLTGKKTWIINGDYSEFAITINLFKYGNATAVKNKFIEIYSHRNHLVSFYPHRDAPAMKNSSNADVLFRITDIKPFYLEDDENLDALTLVFKSSSYTDLTKNLL